MAWALFLNSPSLSALAVLVPSLSWDTVDMPQGAPRDLHRVLPFPAESVTLFPLSNWDDSPDSAVTPSCAA